MDKAYDPKDIEQRIYRRWEERGWFAPSGSGMPFCIMIPPPNVTGTLHMGHAFQDTIMDTLIRYHRMQGSNTLWQPGTDHAGIATQMVVERQLETQGLRRTELGREAFVERVWAWKEQSGSTITRQLRRLGASVDWRRERFTMDPELSRAVSEVFVRLYEEGLVYRGKRLVNWDPVLHTAISDLEVSSEEEPGHLWHLRYPLADGEGHLVVATTRPETMLGDTAVAVHPEDERYRHLIGRQVRLPLAERLIPIIGDQYVDPEFGSGCVKITPAHDFNDYEIGKRHALPQINILDQNATLNEAVPEAYRGLDRFVARERIVEDLRARDLLERVERHTLNVPRGDRSGAVLEPWLTDQWFVKAAELAAPAIAAVEDGRVRFIPEAWAKTYFEWMRNIQDWCISRQLWWGHRIPAWYDDARGRVYVGRSEEEVRARHGLGAELALRRDEDVLDTWFSSALWPFSTLGWPDETAELETFYPTSTLVTGFDIIFFWVARMIMLGLKFRGDVPFREVYITGLIRDQDGRKMSKSYGNVLDPLDLIDGVDLESLVAKRTSGLMQPQLAPRIEADTRARFPQGMPAHGTDALRFTLASLASPTRHINFDLGRLEGYRNFCNKLWNAARFALMHVGAKDARTECTGETASPRGLAERWIESRLHHAAASVHESLPKYRLDLAAGALYQFTWHEFCDWYLELAKPVLQDPQADPAARARTVATLAQTLEALLRLLHPIMPFITEEIWQRVAAPAGREGETIMLQSMPQSAEYAADAEAEAEMSWLQALILEIRRIRSEKKIAPGKPLPVVLGDTSEEDRRRLREHARALTSLARLQSLTVLDADQEPPPAAAVALVGTMKVHVPLADLIDLQAERQRLVKQRDKVIAELERCRGKLDNPKFRDKAPEAVVARERERADTLASTVAELEQHLTRLDH